MSGKLSIVGGVWEQGILTKDLYKTDRRMYDYYKLLWWIELLKNGEMPVKWYIPSKTGTKVKYHIVANENQEESAIKDIEKYISEYNETYKSEIRLCFGKKMS